MHGTARQSQGRATLIIINLPKNESLAVTSMAAATEWQVSSEAKTQNEFGDQLLRQLRGGSGGGGGGGGGGYSGGGYSGGSYGYYGSSSSRNSSSGDGEIPMAVVIVVAVLGKWFHEMLHLLI